MCGEYKALEISCGHIPPTSGKYFFNQETGEVFDEQNNLIGHGKPVVKDSKTIGLSVNIIVKSHLIKD